MAKKSEDAVETETLEQPEKQEDKDVLNTTMEPKRSWKGQKEYVHDLYKLNVSTMKRNTSYKRYQPIIDHIEHAHYYHSVDRKGRPQDKCVPVGGHFHYVYLKVGSDGELKATCSVAKQYQIKTLKNGKQKRIVGDIFFEDERTENEHDDFKIIKDDHTHEIEYLHSETMSDQIIKDIQKDNKQRVEGMLQTKKAVFHSPDGPGSVEERTDT